MRRWSAGLCGRRGPRTTAFSRCLPSLELAVDSFSSSQQVSERAAEQELPPFERPTRIPLDFAEHTKLMFDLQWLAYQADVTRVTTFMLGRELGGRAYPELGVPVNHHGLSHHQDDPEKIADLAKINTYHVDLFAYFLEKLRSTPRGTAACWTTSSCSTAGGSATRTSTRM